MFYSQFQKRINEHLAETAVVAQTYCYGHLIQETEEGAILVDRESTCYVSIDEARQFIKQDIVSQSIQSSLHEDVSQDKIASIIKEHHNVRVTDTLIESYIDLASSKLFTTDEVVKDIRKLTDVQRSVYNKIDFVLNDGSSIAINEETLNTINNIFGKETDIIEYMRESTDNFLSVVNQLED